ncbi:unnamed protein product, partial [marine sediment metagenome]
MNKMYLIHLAGQGDTNLNLVNEEQWNYLQSPIPDFPKDIHEVVEIPPPHIQQRIWEECFSD